MIRHDPVLAPSLLAANLPCCAYVACWLLARYGVAAWGSQVSDFARAAGQRWWQLANVVDPDGDGPEKPPPWGIIEAAGIVDDGALLGPAVPVEGPSYAPALRVGRWHVVQRWTRQSLDDAGELRWRAGSPAGPLRGHAYLAYSPRQGWAEVHQSDTRLGYRVSEGAWVGAAGLTGHVVRVAVLS